MNVKTLAVSVFILLAAVPLSADDKKKKPESRAMLETMEAVPCGAKEKGLTGLGTLWASAGITHVNSDEKLCPQYMLRTDEMEYHIRPTDLKHEVLLPVGQEIEFKIKKNHMFVKALDGDRKARSYSIVAMKPANPEGESQSSSVNPVPALTDRSFVPFGNRRSPALISSLRPLQQQQHVEETQNGDRRFEEEKPRFIELGNHESI